MFNYDNEPIHENLISLLNYVKENYDLKFVVVDNIRSLDEQQILFDNGASSTMDSKHLTGKAVDIVPYLDYSIRYDTGLFKRLAVNFKEAATQLKLTITWGGDWDEPEYQHYELN